MTDWRPMPETRYSGACQWIVPRDRLIVHEKSIPQVVQQDGEGRKSTQRVEVNRRAFSGRSGPMYDYGFAIARHKLPQPDASPSRTRRDASSAPRRSCRKCSPSLSAHARAPDGRDGECHADHHEPLVRGLL